jgi:2-hydroxychromene-2-carboxylate isomerase
LNTIIDYYFTVSSPWSYLGATRLSDIASRNHANICYTPVDISDIFSKTGGVLLKDRSMERQNYRFSELDRWRKRLNIEINLRPNFLHASDRLANKVIVVLRQMSIDPGPLAMAFGRAIWLEDKDISDPEVVEALINEQELDAKLLIATAQSRETEDKFQRDTDVAISRGVFGVPSYVISEHLFWGQDRLDFLEMSLSKNSSKHL